MPGMNSGLNPADPTLVNAFRSALLHQWRLAATIFVLLLLAWAAIRAWVTVQVPGGEADAGAQPQDAGATAHAPGGVAVPQAARAPAEPGPPAAAGRLRPHLDFRRDLAGPAGDAAGMPSQVIQPAAASSPAWVQHLVNLGGTLWIEHPVTRPPRRCGSRSGSAWLLWRRIRSLVAVRRAASVGWGLIVWVFGEAFGGIFAPGVTWLFGAPGAVIFYVAAGVLLALPERAWRRPGPLGRLAESGAFFVGMAVLQAWPGRGFWQGTAARHPGSLTAMVRAWPRPRSRALFAVVKASVVRRRPWLGGQPVRGGGAGGARRGVPAGRPRLSRGGHCRGGAVPGRLGADRGPGLLRWRSAPTPTP